MPTGTDPIQFTPEPHDVRIERNGWVYYVRGVRRGERFVGGGLTPEGGVAVVLIGLVAGRRLQAWHERQPWKVGVVCLRADGGGIVRTVHKERAGASPVARIAALADEVRAGRFEPA